MGIRFGIEVQGCESLAIWEQAAGSDGRGGIFRDRDSDMVGGWSHACTAWQPHHEHGSDWIIEPHGDGLELQPVADGQGTRWMDVVRGNGVDL